jgi:hypothetical protein
VTQIVVAAEKRMRVSAATAYGCIADFERHHAKFLPPSFRDLTVERGGVGAGTVITFDTTTGGRTRHFRSEIAEPEPGRVLVESDADQGTRTTFTVTPQDAGCLVRIENEFRASPGFMGLVECLVAPRILRATLIDELSRLDAYASSLETSGA